MSIILVKETNNHTVKDQSLFVTVMEIIICSKLFVPSLPQTFSCPINLGCDQGIFFEQRHIYETDSGLTRRKRFGEQCAILFALWCCPLTLCCQQGCPSAWVPDAEKHWGVSYHYRTQGWYNVNNKQLHIVILSLLFCT